MSRVFPKISLPSISDDLDQELSMNAREVMPEEICQESIRTTDTNRNKRLFIRFNTTPMKQIEDMKELILPELEFNQTYIAY